jgi:hypothetical protein
MWCRVVWQLVTNVYHITRYHIPQDSKPQKEECSTKETHLGFKVLKVVLMKSIIFWMWRRVVWKLVTNVYQITRHHITQTSNPQKEEYLTKNIHFGFFVLRAVDMTPCNLTIYRRFDGTYSLSVPSTTLVGCLIGLLFDSESKGQEVPPKRRWASTGLYDVFKTTNI